MRKIVFWGAGNKLKQFMQDLELHNLVIEDTFLYIVDSDENKQGNIIGRLRILSPDKLREGDVDLIIVTPEKTETIYLDITKMKLKISTCDLESYYSQIVISNQYHKQCNRSKNRIYKNDNKIIVYTAISKGYDKLLDPVIALPNVEYICFTDDKTLKSNVWKIINVDFGEDSQRAIREYKIKPHLFVEGAEISIWIDGNIIVTGNICEYIKNYFYNGLMLLFPHPFRVCIYDEAEMCSFKKKDNPDIIEKQILRYKKENYPINAGLYCGGIIVRKHTSPEVINCMDLWWKEVSLFSYRDQISLPYAIKKTGLAIDLCLENIYQNDWFKVKEHSR